MALSAGPTDASMSASGKQASNTVEERTSASMDNRNQASGKMAKRSSGSTKTTTPSFEMCAGSLMLIKLLLSFSRNYKHTLIDIENFSLNYPFFLGDLLDF